jgi:hypothetical protein
MRKALQSSSKAWRCVLKIMYRVSSKPQIGHSAAGAGSGAYRAYRQISQSRNHEPCFLILLRGTDISYAVLDNAVSVFVNLAV